MRNKKVNIPSKTAENMQGPEGDNQQNRHYLSVSHFCGLFKYVLLFVLIVFIAVSYIKNGEYITYNNLAFMAKDFSLLSNDTSDILSLTVRYDADSSARYALYKSGLVTVGSSKTKIYNSAGKQTLTSSSHFSDPHIAVSDKYVLAYDLGGTEYAVYNSFANLHSETLDYAISCAAISDSGYYAVASKTREYTSAVRLYNKNFDLVGQYLKDKYVMCVSFDSSGKKLMIVSASVENGSYVTDISICELGKDTESVTQRINDVFPLKAAFGKDGGFTVMTDSGVYFFSSEGERIASYSYDAGALRHAALSEKFAALVTAENAIGTVSSIIVFDTSGKIVYNGSSSGEVGDISVCDSYLYVLYDTRLERFDTASFEKSTADVSVGALELVCDKNYAVLCYSTHSQYVSFDKSQS